MTFEELIERDEAVSKRIAHIAENRVIHGIAWVLARTGDSIFWLIVSGVLIWLKKPVGWPLLITIGITALFTAVAKGIFKRERPSSMWAISTDIYSFPSGHAARSGAVAVTLAIAFPEYTLLIFIWSVIVALSRVVLSRHYMFDVVGGLLFGIVVSLVMHFILRIWF